MLFKITRLDLNFCQTRHILLRGFTLVELLVVLSIMILLMTLVTPAMNNILYPAQLTQGAQMLSDQLSLARQTALTRNHSIEVRFYQFGDPEIPGEQPASPSTGKYRAVQLFDVEDSGTAVALSKVQRLPPSVIIDGGVTLSSIIGLAQSSPGVPTSTTGAALNIALPRVKNQYNSSSFRFLPNGSTNLPPLSSTGGQWFLTLHGLNEGDRLGAAPSNFFTIQIDANNGHTKTFRP
jgi:uncharacterized protein (TIGR02596 family)